MKGFFSKVGRIYHMFWNRWTCRKRCEGCDKLALLQHLRFVSVDHLPASPAVHPNVGVTITAAGVLTFFGALFCLASGDHGDVAVNPYLQLIDHSRGDAVIT